jgi:hypothetical protein
MKRENSQLVLNCDETSWKLYPNSILTWTDAGSQSVKISITGNEKDAFTVMATVRPTGQKLPLYILVKGETVRSKAMQLGELGDNGTDHCQQGG